MAILSANFSNILFVFIFKKQLLLFSTQITKGKDLHALDKIERFQFLIICRNSVSNIKNK